MRAERNVSIDNIVCSMIGAYGYRPLCAERRQGHMSIVSEHLRTLFRSKAVATPPVSVIPLSVPERDHAEEEHPAHEPVPGQVELAEGQSFVIQYRDAVGQFSTRSITVWAIRTNAQGIPSLIAKCHLRNETRAFRLDRIEAIADYDGVLIEPMDEFIRDTFGIVWKPGSGYTPPPVEEASDSGGDTWTLIRRVCRGSAVQLLCAVALADGEMTAEEIEKILGFLYRRCHDSRIDLEPAHLAKLRLYVKRMQATPETIERALDRLVHSSPAVISEVIDACLEVMDADGIRDPAEIELLQALVREMRGAAYH